MLDRNIESIYIGGMPHKLSNSLAKALKIIIIIFSLASFLFFFYQSVDNYSDGNHLTSYINASRLFYQGENPFTLGPHPYIYPLFLSMAAYPLTFLQSGFIPKAITSSLWSLLSSLVFFLTIIMSWRYVDRIKSRMTVLRQNLFTIALLIVMLLPFLRDNFLKGQIDMIVLGGIGGFFCMLRKDRQLWAALFLSVAASISIGPALCILYVFFTRQYRAAMAFIPLMFLLNIGFPFLINPQSLDYYKYLFADVVPRMAEGGAAGGFNSFSLISTVSHLFSASWTTNLKLALSGLCTIGLFIPPTLFAAGYIMKAGRFFIYTFFATIISIIPLTFPMSAPHQLLIMAIPFVAILMYWRNTFELKTGFWKDGLSLLLLGCAIALQLGHFFMQPPLCLLALLGIYVGLNMILWKMRKGHDTD
jgi:hypothetical protein